MIIQFINNKQIDLLLDGSIIKDYKTLLQEITQKNQNCLPSYKVLKEEGLEHPLFEKLGQIAEIKE